VPVGNIPKITTDLFDGRQIHYFDDKGSDLPSTRKKDLRETASRPPLADLKHDPLTGEWIAVAAHRHTRAYMPPSNECPLSPATGTYLSEVPDNFDVVVFENKNPAFGALPDGLSIPILESSNAIGLNGVRQVFPFENRGQEIGVTLHHPHGQIYCYPYVTPRTRKLLESIKSYGSSFFQDLLEFEQASNRVLIKSESFTAYVPFAARWPMEAHLLPNRHVKNHADLTDDERLELADVYSKLLRSFELAYDTPSPYIAAWHQAPLVPGGENARLQLQITSPRRAADKLKYLAGSESAMGAFIADIPAEDIAAQLKENL